MTRWPLAALVVASVFALAPALASAADAEEKEACARAYEAAQRLRKKAQLRASRHELLECVKPSCPAVLSTDCAGWLREVESALPTVVLIVRDESGRDLVDVLVWVDGVKVATKLDGAALEVDPGRHVFRFLAPERDPIEQALVVQEGERHRAVTVTFAPQHAAPPLAVPAASMGAPVDAPGVRPVVYVLGGVGVAAIAGFAYFGITGLNQESDLQRCRPHCDDGAVRDARRSFLVADVSLGVGIAALVGATYFYVRPRPPTSASVWVAPSVSGSGGFHAGIGGRFGR